MTNPSIATRGDRLDHPALRLDAACDRFESAWRAGRRPRIEDCLIDAAGTERADLLHALLQVERDLRRGDGEDPDPDEYRRRFPDDPRPVAEAFDDSSSTGIGAAGTIRLGPPRGSAPGPSRTLTGTDGPRGRADGRAGPIRDPAAARPGRPGRGLRRLRQGAAPRGRPQGDPGRTAPTTARAGPGSCSRPRSPGASSTRGSCRSTAWGSYGDGRPFYAMRFMRGDSLKAAIERFHAADGPARDPGDAALALRDLLRRFIDVCNAIAYAHSRGVLHRDIKPGNVMLGKYGETLVVDWGLAKAIGRAEGRAGDGAERGCGRRSAGGSTADGRRVGTGDAGIHEPRAGRRRARPARPASDIYSLGATLYCLLTGRAPLDDGDGDTDERLRRARAGEFAAPRQVKREVPPALEAICQKAMARPPRTATSRPRQWPTTSSNGWPTSRSPPAASRWTTRARRWAKRHRTPMAAAAVALAAGVIGLAVLTVVEKTANDQLRAADTAKGLALAEAQAVRVEARAALTFFQDKVLAAARPKDQDGGLGIDATIRAAIDAAEPEIETSFADQPAVEASIRHTMGVSYLYLGDLVPAIRQHERALALRRGSSAPTTRTR